MERELSVLAKLYEGNEKLFDFHPRQDGTKKERLFYLYVQSPNKGKSFYRCVLFGEGYNGTAYDVLRKELANDILAAFGPPCLEARDLKRGLWEKYTFINRVAGIRNLINSRMVALWSIPKLIDNHRKTAEKYVLVSELQYLNRLLLDAAATSNESNRIKLLLKDLEDSSVLLRSELTYSLLRTHIQSGFSRVKNSRKDLIHELEDRLKIFENELPSKYREHFSIRILRLKAYISDAKKDYQSLNDQALVLLNNCVKHSSPNSYEMATLYLFYANANLNNEALVEKWWGLLLKCLQGGSYNWFISYETMVSFRLFRLEVDEASSLLIAVMSSEHFSKLNEAKKGLWTAYLEYALFASKLGLGRVELNTRRNLERTRLDGVSSVAQNDKVGVNFSMLVLEMLEGLRKDRFEVVIDQYEGLARYRTRYFKGEENQRPKIFIGMLLKVIQLDFNAFEVEKKTRRQLEKLKAMKPNLNINMGGNEIIRYEVLWEWILKKLKESSLLPKPKA